MARQNTKARTGSTVSVAVDLGALKPFVKRVARASGVTVNEFICDTLKSYVRREREDGMINDTLIICDGSKFIRVRFTDAEPDRVSSPWDARHWQSLVDAQKYRERFPKQNQNWRIKVFRATALWDAEQCEVKGK